MIHRLQTRLAAGLVLLLLCVTLVGCTDITIPPRPSPIPPDRTPSPDQKPLAGPGIPGLYLAWGSAANGVPPTREPGDPAGPGNEVFGLDCLTYLGSGGDVGVNGVWERQQTINWSSVDYCISEAAKRTVTLPDGEVIPQPVILTLPSSYADAGSRWYQTDGHGAPGTEDNPFIRLHLPTWMQNDTYRFTFQAPTGQWYQSIRYGGDFKARMIELMPRRKSRMPPTAPAATQPVSTIRQAADSPGPGAQ